MGSRVRGRLKREGTYVRILMADSHCCGTQHYKVTIFQLKKNFFNDGTEWKNQGIKIFTVKTGLV